MRTLFIVSLIALAACTAQQPQMATYAKDRATACIDVDGSQAVVSCQQYESALTGPKEEGFCTCPTPSRQVTAEYCAPGERIPVESSEYRAAVRAATQDGSLVGDKFNGERMCIERSKT